jgi:glycosyltransferase involved in cell wall biosynthesis
MAGKSKKSSSPDISLIVPIYNEEGNIKTFFDTVLPVLESLEQSWEVICIDDGSTDQSRKYLLAFRAKEKRIKLVSFARNFGKEIALTAGLDVSKGKAVIPIDVDLQDPPELIPEMIRYWKEGHKVVLAVRHDRGKEGWFRRLLSKSFYAFFNRVSSLHLVPNAGDYRLMDRQVVAVINQMRERTRLMKGVFVWPGFKPYCLYFDRHSRSAGKSHFSLRGLWRLAWDGIISFSTLPLVLWIYLGGFVSLASLLYAVVIVTKTLVFGVDVPGYASLMVVVLLLGGMQLLSLGFIGLYVHKIFKETKQRPLYVIEESHGL